MKNLIPYFYGLFVFKNSPKSRCLLLLQVLGICGFGSSCTQTTGLLEPTGQNKISLVQANAKFDHKKMTSNAIAFPELDGLQEEINSLKQLLAQAQAASNTSNIKATSASTSKWIRTSNSESALTKSAGQENQVPTLSNPNLPHHPNTVIATERHETQARPQKVVQIEADARLLPFHVLATDKTLITTLKRWAEQERWSVKLNGDLVAKEHFPAHTVAYSDFLHGEKIKSLGGATLLHAVGNLMQQHQVYQNEIQFEVQLRNAESQMVITAQPKTTHNSTETSTQLPSIAPSSTHLIP